MKLCNQRQFHRKRERERGNTKTTQHCLTVIVVQMVNGALAGVVIAAVVQEERQQWECEVFMEL